MKNEIEILKKLKEIKDDERLSYPSANVEINAPLALIQISLEGQISILKWVLDGKALHDYREKLESGQDLIYHINCEVCGKAIWRKDGFDTRCDEHPME